MTLVEISMFVALIGATLVIRMYKDINHQSMVDKRLRRIEEHLSEVRHLESKVDRLQDSVHPPIPKDAYAELEPEPESDRYGLPLLLKAASSETTPAAVPALRMRDDD